MNVVKFSRIILTMLMVGGSIAVMSACDEKGRMEKAGESVDKAVQDAGEAIEDAGDEVEKKRQNNLEEANSM